MTRRESADRPGAEGAEADLKARLDELVDEASMESFPASDPPAFWARDERPSHVRKRD